MSRFAADFFGISVENAKRDYFIVLMIEKLARSPYGDTCVFKGGTSLSKCYPGSINRFSEDIDLTYMPNEEISNKEYDKALKKIESVMSEGFEVEKIDAERNDRNKSSWVWYKNENKDELKVKLEIGSKIKPDPYHKAQIRPYIQEYLLAKGMLDDCKNLKTLISKTKETDGFYLKKRNISTEYNPLDKYDFESWIKYFDSDVETNYLKLSENLLFDKNTKLNFAEVIETFRKIDFILNAIDE